MINNTMIPYNQKKDLETNYYSKTEVELLVAGGGTGGTIDLSNYYKKLETYSKEQVDALISSGTGDLSDYYTKAEVDSLITNSGADLSNYYTKAEVNNLIPDISTKQDVLVSGTSIKTINGESILGSGDLVISGGGAVDLSGYYNKTQTETLLTDKVDKEVGKGLSTNDFTDTFKQALELNKVQNITTNSVTKKLVVTYTNGTSVDLNLDDVITDVKVESATLDATTNVLTILSSDGGADVTVDLSVFVTNQTLNNALVGKADKIHTHSTSDIDGLDTTLSSKVDKNEAIIGATKTKITYDSNGLVTGGADLVEADLPNISQAKITNLVSDLSNKQEVLVSGTSIKTINGESILGNGNIEITSEEVDLTNYYDKTNTDTLLSNKVDKITGKGLSTNDFTDTFKQALELKKVQDISTDSVTKKLVVTYTDGTVVNLNINDIVTDVKVSGATLDATTNVLTLTSTDGGVDVTVDLSDFVNSSELTTALAGKVSKIVSTDDAIVAFSGTTGDVRDSLFKIADLKTYIGKASTKIVATDLKTLGVATVNWIGGIVPTAKAGATTVTGLIGAIAGTWNKIGDSTTLLTTAKTTIVEAINELFNGKVSKIGADDIEVTLATKGVILKSPNGTRDKITVNDDGSLQTTGV